MRIIITDVTHMSDSNLCIAGWSEAENRMIRPIRHDGQGWTIESLGISNLKIGDLLEFEPVNSATNGSFPHTTEDYMVSNNLPQLIEEIDSDEFLNRVGNISNSPDELFQGNLTNSKFVDEGSHCPSLGAVNIECNSIEFIESYGKLKCDFTCNGINYEWIRVTGVSLNNIYRKQGVAALNNMKLDRNYAYIRLGLARAYMRDGNLQPCTMMVNNVFFY